MINMTDSRTTPWTVRLACSGFILAFICAFNVEHSRLTETNTSFFEQTLIASSWIASPFAMWLIIRQNVWAGHIWALITGASMVFLRLNVDWLHREGFVATALFSLATLLRFISLLLLARAKRQGWFGPVQSSGGSALAQVNRTYVKAPLPALQAVIGVLLGSGAVLLVAQTPWRNSQLIGSVCVFIGVVLFGIIVWHFTKR
ncbi:MAG TPA: hypothetical protein VGL08_01555 [Paraburkholderia sp.]|jgi:hypothetical protein